MRITIFVRLESNETGTGYYDDTIQILWGQGANNNFANEKYDENRDHYQQEIL